ncbi:MAG: ATP-binding protein [Gammaproteobacteria bacterium]|nr:ATP-binding protein [Gammaproteobacteria bacterium]
MQDFEKLGAFYLGKKVAPDGERTDELILYDSKDLTTHGVIIGMTGSGKTGLGVGVIEEAAMDHVPVIALDPKGDLGNLLLTFPKLRPADFEPWVDPRAAADKGQTPQEFAKTMAGVWKKGLAGWGQTPARIGALRNAVDMAIYTPGSAAGTPLSVLREFSAPEPELLEDADLYRERVQSTATGLLTLLGIDADPVTSPEHILIANVLDKAWQEGRSLDLGALIAAIQDPGIDRIGVMDLDAFFPPKERFALAMRVNNLLAAPGFEAWMEGPPLNIDRLLYGDTGKPQVSVLSIAHLGDAERMFFVTMLLTELVGWMRRQPGSGSLRAILYMDEIFGYLPPVANPPSKQLFLTLLKQARAFGLGLVLSTQNPVDLDYKALSNCGTWFIGRLQTERDQARVKDGLMGAAGSGNLDMDKLDETLAGLGKRRFLLHNVHEQEPALMETRWVMSYLAGPLTRDQIKLLAASQPKFAATADPEAAEPVARSAQRARPVLPPDIRQLFAPPQSTEGTSEGLVYYPRLIAAGDVNYSNARLKVSEQRPYLLAVEPEDTSGTVNWAEAQELSLTPGDLDRHPDPDAAFAECPACLTKSKQFKAWEKTLRRHLRTGRPLILYKSKVLKATSNPGESERDFRIRLQQLGNEQRDLKVAKLRERYEKKVATQEERLRRAEQAVEREAEQARAHKLDTALSFGTAVLGALLGRKRISATSASRVGTAVRKAGRAGQQAGDVRRAKETVASVHAKLAELEAAFDKDVEALDAAFDAQAEMLDEVAVNPRATDLHVGLIGIGWFPYVEDADGRLRPA